VIRVGQFVDSTGNGQTRRRSSVSGDLRLRLALTRAEAAEAIGMSLDSFERYVQADLRLIRRGRIRLVPIGELERWLAENAERPMAEQLRGPTL
jgi:hypothetical protein